jgi:hypothetical protein
MRYLEIVLKLAFLIGAVCLYIQKATIGSCVNIFLLISLLLGIILIINKDSSYHYPQTKRDYIIRRIEGGILIVFSILFFFLVK